MRFHPSSFLASLLAVAALSACSSDDPPPMQPERVAASVSVAPGDVTLTALGDTVRFTATVRDQYGDVLPNAAVVWSSSLESVATVSSSGLVSAQANGTAVIEATAGNATGPVVVTVDQEIESIALVPDSVQLDVVGDTFRLELQALDVGGSPVPGTDPTFDIDPSTLVSVTQDGLLTAEASGGVATVTATVGSLEATATVYVRYTPDDLISLLSGTYRAWWEVNHHDHPGPALSVMADDHTSPWGNWGMQDAGAEPRPALVNDPDYEYADVLERPWQTLHEALMDSEGPLELIESDQVSGLTEDDVRQLRTFANFTRGLNLGTLAQLYDQAFLVTRHAEDGTPELAPYPVLLDSALAALDRAVELSEADRYIWYVPGQWLSTQEVLDSRELVRLAHAFKARFRASVPRTPQERGAVDWNAVLAEIDLAHDTDWGADYNGQTWGWGREKLHTGSISGWARLDLRTLGPADATGQFAAWLAASPDGKVPFDIDTDDRRVTGGTPSTDGSLVRYIADNAFPPERGVYHLSNYMSSRWEDLTDGIFEGAYPDYPVMELDFLRAEALYRTGNPAGAMAIVNQYRANGELPDFSTPGGVAPGGDRCVPKPDGLTCGDLWEALKYEKRIELFHFGLGTAFFDDRGWGDLVEGTAPQFPVPAGVLQQLGLPIYTYGGVGSAPAGMAPALGPDPARVRAYFESLGRRLTRGTEDRAEVLSPR